MKRGLHSYAVIVPTENSYIRFNNNKINSLQTYDIAQTYRILREVVQGFPQLNIKISNHRHIQKLRQRK
jgi:hypothetical protein